MRGGGSLGLLIITVLGGCGGDAPAAPEPPVDSTPATVVGPAGGVVSLQNGAVVVDVPAGALDSSVTLSATAVTAPAGAGLVAGTVWDLAPTGLTFQVPVRVTLRFAPADVPASVDPAELRLYARTPGGPWRRLPGSGVDPSAGTVAAELSTFSTKGVGVPVATVMVHVPGSLTYRVPVAVTATARDGAGNVLTAREIDPVAAQEASIVQTDGQGNAVGIAPGTTALSASSEGVSGMAAVTVGQASAVRVCDDAAPSSAPTIAEALAGVTDGATVTLCAATFAERVLIERPVVLRGESGVDAVVEAPPPSSGTEAAIDVRPGVDGITVSHLTVSYAGEWGIRAFLVDDLTIDSVAVHGPRQGIAVGGGPPADPADLVVRRSTIDGGPGSPMVVGIFVSGRSNALVEHNAIRRTSQFACIQYQSLAGGTIRNNLVDECGGRGIVVLSNAGTTVDVVGNTVRNSTATASLYGIWFGDEAAGRIERNVVVDYVHQTTTMPSSGIRALSPNLTAVRFNDIAGNTAGGLEGFVGLDATCNWWGGAAGPGGANNGVTGGPTVSPWATAPIALTSNTTCSGT